MESAELQPEQPGATGQPDSTVRTWAMACHLAALAGLLGIPFLHIIGPLVVWLLKREEHPFIDENGKRALNFQISVTIYAFAGLIVSAILTLILIGLVVGVLFGVALFLFWIAMVILAAVKVSAGEQFDYPLSIRFLR